MTDRGGAGARPRPRARAHGVVVPFPRVARPDRVELGRLVPSGRALAGAFALLGAVLVAIVLARETSLFAVATIEVSGAHGGIQRQVRDALTSARGESLLSLDVAEVRRDVEALPTVAAATVDRAFPHALRISVAPERAVAVVRQGASSYLVSERGRVVGRSGRRVRPELARIWVAKGTTLTPGAFVEGELRTAVSAVSPLAGARFPARVTSVVTAENALTLRLRSGLELRLGDTNGVDLKLAVAGRILPLLRPGTTYLDVSVPDRPVAGTEQ